MNASHCAEEAFQLLSDRQQLKQAMSQSQSFLKQLAEHPSLLKDMLDIGLRPTYYQQQKGHSLTTDLPALAIDTLVNLYEEFIDLLVFDKILKKDASLEGFELQDQQAQREMVGEQQGQTKQEYKLMSYMHLCVMEGQFEETVYCYLNRLIGPLSYQRPFQLIQFYQSKPEIMATIIQRMDQRGIADLFCKLLECEYGKQFFKDYKSKYMTTYLQRVKKGVGLGGQLGWLEGLQQIYRFFTEKMQEQNDQNKYLSLLQTLRKSQLQLLMQVNQSIENGNHEIVMISLKWVEELLKHDGHVMGQNNVRLSITHMNRKNSISNNFYGDQRTQPKRVHHLGETHLKEVLAICKKVSLLYLATLQSKTPIGQLLISFYRVLYFLIRIWVHSSRDKHIANPHLITTLINDAFLSHTLGAVVAHPQSTSLHNCAKQVIIECIREGMVNTIYFYQADGAYYKMLRGLFPKDKHNIGVPFSQQLFHIYKEVVIANPHVSSPIETILLTQTQRVNKPIGYDPRKLHEDNLRGSSNAFSESSQNIEEIVQFELYSNNSLQVGSNKSFTPSILKVHNSTSLERCDLGEVGEERIVIEGMQQDD